MASLQPAHDASQSWLHTKPNESNVMEEQKQWEEGKVTPSKSSIQVGDDSEQSGRSYDHSVAASMTASPAPAQPQSWKSRLHLAFQEDIPHPLRGLMFAVFFFLNTHVLLQLLSLAAVVSDYPADMKVADFILFLLFSVFAYVFWYRPLYTAFRCRSTFYFFCFLFVFFGQLSFYFLQFVRGLFISRRLLFTLEERRAYQGVFFCVLTVLTMAQGVAGVVLWLVAIGFWISPRRNPRRQ